MTTLELSGPTNSTWPRRCLSSLCSQKQAHSLPAGQRSQRSPWLLRLLKKVASFLAHSESAVIATVATLSVQYDAFCLNNLHHTDIQRTSCSQFQGDRTRTNCTSIEQVQAVLQTLELHWRSSLYLPCDLVKKCECEMFTLRWCPGFQAWGSCFKSSVAIEQSVYGEHLKEIVDRTLYTWAKKKW